MPLPTPKKTWNSIHYIHAMSRAFDDPDYVKDLLTRSLELGRMLHVIPGHPLPVEEAYRRLQEASKEDPERKFSSSALQGARCYVPEESLYERFARTTTFPAEPHFDSMADRTSENQQYAGYVLADTIDNHL